MNLVVRSGCFFLISALLFSDPTASYSVERTFEKDGQEHKNSTSDKRESTKSDTIWKDEIAVAGKRYELVCMYEGTPSAPLVWSRDGKPFQSSDRVKESKYGQSLIIESVTLDDLGSYTCEKSNDDKSSQSYSIHLEIEYAPYFLTESHDEYVNLGETVKLKCFALSWPRPSFEWRRHGKAIGSSSRLIVYNEKLIIKDVGEEDIGAYSCNATNPHGYVYREITVNVPPVAAKIVQLPTDVVTVDGKIANMTCQVSGAPMPEVQWMRDGEELIGGRFKKMNTGNLQIHDVRLSDAGEYRCEAINRFGRSAASARLVVKNRTKIVEGPKDYKEVAGGLVMFTCNAETDSTLELQIDWQKNGQPIEFKSDLQRFLNQCSNCLIINDVSEADSGTYTCVARTDLDEARAEATLVLREAPKSPTIVGVTCGDKEAQVSWAPAEDNRQTILRYSIEYNTSFAPDTWEIIILDDYQTHAVKSLSPGTNYTFRVIARNEYGPSEPSSLSSVCTTLPDVPYKNPENVTGKGDSPQDLVIRWNVMPPIEHNAPKFIYRVYYKRDIPGEKWIKEDIHDWRTNHLKVFNQPTYQRYRIMVGAINERGETWETSKEVIGYSGEDVPLEAPGNFTLKRIVSNTTALLSWTKVPDEKMMGEHRGYKVVTWNDKDGEEASQEFYVEWAGKTFALVNTFVPNTKNYAVIKACNGRYNGPPSEIISFEMPSVVSEMPE